MSKTPILETYEYKGEYLAWCPFCETWHYHGIGDGHRAAHCYVRDVRYKNKWLELPFCDTGYILQCKGRLTPIIRSQYKDRHKLCVGSSHCEECLKNVKAWREDD